MKKFNIDSAFQDINKAMEDYKNAVRSIERNHPSQDTEKSNDIDLSGSWIYRLEYLLAGKTFEEYEEAVDEMFSLEQEFYKRKIDELQKERNSISLEEAEQELEDYHNFVDLLHKKPSKLTTEEKRLIYDVYKSAKQEEFKFLKTLDEYDPDEDTLFAGKKFEDIVQDVELKLEQPKLTRINDDINWYLEKLNKSRNLSKNYYLVAINRDALFNNYDNVYDLVRNISNSASQKNKKILLAIDDDGFQKKKPSEIRVPYSYSPEERSKILNLHYAIPRVEEIYFSEFQPLSVLPFDKEKLWTYDDVMYSYTNTLKSELRKITDTIGLSPFEKIIVVHNYTVHHNYRKTPIENSKSFGKLARLHPKMFSQLKSENFKFMLESDYEREGTIITDRCYIDPNEYKGFVCCGFSSVEKAFLDSLEDPNISTEFLGIQFYDKETNECISAHSVLLVRFKDDKYGIKGNYVLDPTWDATLQGFAFCLFPISDYKVYKDSSRYARIYAPENNSAFYSILASKTMKNPSDFILGDREIEDSEPIPFDTFCEAFTTLEEATKHDVFKENPLLRYQFELNEGFAKKAVENTIHSLNHFDPMLAKNDFYRKIRDFFKKHAKDGKYKDWEENFAEYSQKLVWNRE